VTDAEKALRIVRDSPLITFDTETSGTDWRRNFPVGYVICGGPTEEDAVYVPVRAGGGGNLPDPSGNVKTPLSPFEDESMAIHPFEKDLARAFTERKGLTVGHNMKFDVHMAANAGILLGRNLSCTQNNEALLDEYNHGFSLEACAERHKVRAKRGDELYQHIGELFGIPGDRKSMANFWKLSGDDPVAATYARGDGITTYELHLSQQKMIEEQKLQAIMKLESDLLWTLFRIERKGIRVDTEYLHQLLEELDKKLETTLSELPPDFNVRSPVQLQKYFEDAGRTNWPKTDKGNPSFTEKWLKGFPEGERIVAVRKFTNLGNSFIKPLIEKHVVRGRVHATLNQLKADDYGTPARFSCSDPNLQQIPKRDKELAPLFRRAFVADEGFEFNEADFSECEPRLYAHYSKDEKLVNGYCNDPKFSAHTIVAELLHVERDPTAKRMNMGIITGMFPKSFSAHMGWSLEKGTEMWNQWHRTFPAIQGFQQLAKQTLQNRGYVRTILGRRMRLEQPRFAYRAVSKIIQGGNADIIKYAMLQIDKMLEADGDQAHLLMTVHDSLEWQNPLTEHGRELSNEIKRMMVDVQGLPFELRVPFKVDHKAGPSWSEATF